MPWPKQETPAQYGYRVTFTLPPAPKGCHWAECYQDIGGGTIIHGPALIRNYVCIVYNLGAEAQAEPGAPPPKPKE